MLLPLELLDVDVNCTAVHLVLCPLSSLDIPLKTEQACPYTWSRLAQGMILEMTNMHNTNVYYTYASQCIVKLLCLRYIYDLNLFLKQWFDFR